MTDDEPQKAKGRGRGALHLGETSSLPAGAPKDAAALEFGRRLQKAMVEKGWNQAELGRRALVHMPKGKSMSRDAISKYINGLTMPNPMRLAALSAALGMDQKDLMPMRQLTASADRMAPLDVRDMGDGTTWLRVNQAVPWPVAVKVLALLKGEE